jgi:hypothetical protein
MMNWDEDDETRRRYWKPRDIRIQQEVLEDVVKWHDAKIVSWGAFRARVLKERQRGYRYRATLARERVRAHRGAREYFRTILAELG